MVLVLASKPQDFALTLIEFAVMAGLTSGEDGLDKDANVALC